ncbi:MAG: UDP-glucose 4-epimerase, partial [Candidatus Pelagibacterales bacterium]
AKNQIFLASDDNDISLSDLVCLLSKSMNKSPRLFSLPNFLIKNVANVSGYSDQFKNLTEPLRIDLSKTKKLLNWSPVLDLNEGLNKMTNWYLNR